MHNVSRRTAFFVPPLITSPRRAVHTLSPIFIPRPLAEKRFFFTASEIGRPMRLSRRGDTLSRIFIPLPSPLPSEIIPSSLVFTRSARSVMYVYMYIYIYTVKWFDFYANTRVYTWRDERRRRSDGGGTALIKQRIRVSSRSAVSAFDEPFIFQ